MTTKTYSSPGNAKKAAVGACQKVGLDVHDDRITIRTTEDGRYMPVVHVVGQDEIQAGVAIANLNIMVEEPAEKTDEPVLPKQNGTSVLDMADQFDEAGQAANVPEKPAKAASEKMTKWKKVIFQAKQGQCPEKPVIASPNRSNQSYQKHIDAISDLGVSALRGKSDAFESLKVYEVKGTNTYAKMTRNYRDAVVAWLESRNA